MNYFDLTGTKAYGKLCSYYRKKPDLKALLTPDAIRTYVVQAGKDQIPLPGPRVRQTFHDL